LAVTRQPGNAHTDKSERARAIGQGTVEQATGKLADLLRIVDADAQRQ
jgi:hypothetical protein